MKTMFTSLVMCFYFLLSAQEPVPNSTSEKGVLPIDQQSTTNNQQTRAVVIGISDYQDEGITDLRFADKDATAFAAYLQSPAGGSLPS